MPKYIISVMPAATATAIKTALTAQVTALTPFRVGLTDEQKQGARTMGTLREGLARLINSIANANINSLARDQNPADLTAALAYDATLEELRQDNGGHCRNPTCQWRGHNGAGRCLRDQPASQPQD